MNFPYYSRDPQAGRPAEAARLPGARRARQTDPAGYLPDPGLVDAVNVALLLGQPLLLTGEPGTGKTQLAYNLAWKLGYETPLIFETKSTTISRELFYTYDALNHFRAVQTGAAPNAIDFITWNALGQAILRSRAESDVAHLFPPGFMHGGARRSVVLIDEIDKAPRDFPNDLLNEIENLYFRAPELNNLRIDTAPELRPVLVLTSNSEKNLPDAFLRRCIYYNIPFPDRERLAEIVQARVGSFENSENRLLADSLDLFFLLRDSASGLRKKPATAELIGWMTALREMGARADAPLKSQSELVSKSLSALVKSADDQTAARIVIEGWRSGPRS
ncbi:MAG TPA: MoxR family ATPase [Blastocatellia bacterium]|nr:MoxR family ATPase [Blastocatellia bacterium]